MKRSNPSERSKTSKTSKKKVTFSEETPEVAYTHPEALSDSGEMNPTRIILDDPSQLVGCKITIKPLTKYKDSHIGMVEASDRCFINVSDEKGNISRYHVLKGCLYDVGTLTYYRYTIFAKNYFDESETYNRKQIEIEYPQAKARILKEIQKQNYNIWLRISLKRYEKAERINSYRKEVLSKINTTKDC